jgi:hypothetical protein
MYERIVVHAIQHKNVKEFHMRYRTYSSKSERDRTFDLIQAEQDEPNEDIVPVTLTITAETVAEQQVLET